MKFGAIFTTFLCSTIPQQTSSYRFYITAPTALALAYLRPAMSNLHTADIASDGSTRNISSSPSSSTLAISSSESSTSSTSDDYDFEYPGTAVKRMKAAVERAKSLSPADLSGDWESVRRKILWAGGLRDLPNAAPGRGYTGHSFNDFNHCDLTTMADGVVHHNNEGKVKGIAYNNRLGEGIKIASLEELGAGGSWSTCMMGCDKDPPQDVAHIQFQSRIAFKLVWCPPQLTSFVLVDDWGRLLTWGTPTGTLPDLQERRQNFQLVGNGKYSTAAIAKGRELYEAAKSM